MHKAALQFLPDFTGLKVIAELFQAACNATVFWTAMDCGYSLLAALACLAHGAGHLVGLRSQPFDPARWPPLFDNPLASTSLNSFWRSRWHQMFYRSFSFIAGDPVRRLARPLGRSLQNALGVLAAFACSSAFHEFGLYYATLHWDSSYELTRFFMLHGAYYYWSAALGLKKSISYRRTRRGRLWSSNRQTSRWLAWDDLGLDCVPIFRTPSDQLLVSWPAF